MGDTSNKRMREVKKITIVASILLLVAVVVFFAFYFLTDINVFLILCFTFGGTVLIGLVLELVYPKNTAAARLRAVLRFFLYIYVFYMAICATTLPSIPYESDAAIAIARRNQLLSYLPLLSYGAVALVLLIVHSTARKLDKNFMYTPWYGALVIALSLLFPVMTVVFCAACNISLDVLILAIPIMVGMIPYGPYCLGQYRQRRRRAAANAE